ncbi:MAG: hypothetical protein J5I47_05105 [Vicingus serpentipes]|nr:hypothetical protein [Vicingus serpentipes]
MRKYFSYHHLFTTLLVVVLLCLAPVANAQWTLDVGGTVKQQETKKRFEGVTITIKRNGTTWKTLTSPANGSFDISLEPNAIYMIEFSKSGYVTKKMEFSTKNVPEEDAKYGFEFPMEMSLFEKREGLDVSILNKPIAKVAFDPNTGYMDYDPEYTKSIKKELERMNDELDELLKKQEEQRKANQAEYDKLIAAGDKAFNGEKWAEAEPFYKKAAEIFKDESYPVAQLKEIEANLAKNAEANKNYLAAIKAGDEAFNNQEWDKAIIQYQKASGYNPDEEYPKNKIKEAKDLMANEKKVTAEYNAAIAEADKAFGAKKYEQAKVNYEKAVAIKTNEAYPKTKLGEIEKLLGEQQKIEREYKNAIAEADGFFNANDYEKSIDSYNKALSLKPAEAYPTSKIVEAKKFIADKKKLEADYQKFIAEADKFFGAKDYTAAKINYQQASAIKKEEQYPKEKLAEIEKIEEETAKKEAEEKQREANYQAAITNGDKAFSAKNFELAKQAYQTASEIKKEEQYPKNKLSEIDKILADAAAKEAEEKAKEEQYKQLIATADGLLSAKDYDGAKGKYNEAIKVKTEEQYPKDKVREIEKILADIANKEAEEKAKEEQYKQLIADADRMLGSKDYNGAKGKYIEATKIKVEEKYPKDKLLEIEKILADAAAKEAEEKAKEEQYKKLVAEADGLLSAKNYEGAKGKYNEAIKVKSEEQYPKDKISEIDALLKELAKQKAEEEAKAKAAAELQAKYEGLIASADKLLGTKDYEGATLKYNEAITLKEEEQYPKDKVREIEKILAEIAKKKAEEEAAKMAQGEKEAKYKEAITLADNAFSSENYKQAILKYNEALSVKPEEQYPKDRIKETETILAEIERKKQEGLNAAKAQKELDEKYNKFIASGDQDLSIKQYTQAKSNYEAALGVKPTEQYPKDKIKEIEAVLAGIAKTKEEESLAAEAERKKQEYFNALIAQADEAFNNKNYDDAKAKYQQALGLIPNSSHPTNRLKEIEAILLKLASETNAAETEKALNEKYNGLISLADNAFSGKDYATAKVNYKAALGVKPNEIYPKNKIDEIDGLLAKLEKEKEEITVTNNAQQQKQEKYNSLVQQGDMSLSAKRYKAAIDSYEMALGIMPNETYPKEKITEINKILNEIALKEKEKESLALAEQAKKEQYEQLIFEGNRMFKFKKYEEAKSKFSEAWGIYPDEKYPPQKIKEIDELLNQPKEEETIVVNTSSGNRATINDDNEKAIEAKIAELLKNKDADKIKAFEEERKSFEEAEEIRITKSVERTDYAHQVLAEIEEELVRQAEKGNTYHLKYYEELKKSKAAIEASEAERIKNAESNRMLAKNDLAAIEERIVQFRREQEKVSIEKMRVHNTFVDGVNETELAMIERGDEVRAQNREGIEKLAEETERNRARSAKRAEELALDVEEYKKELSEQEEIRISGAIERTAQNQKEIDKYIIGIEKNQIKQERYYKLDVEALLAFKENIDNIEAQRIVEADRRRMENDKIKTAHQQEFLRQTREAQRKYEDDVATLEKYRSAIIEQEAEQQQRADKKRMREAEALNKYKESLNVAPPSQEKRYKEFQSKLAEERRLNNQLIGGLQELSEQKRMLANKGLKDFYMGEKQLSEDKELSDKYPEGITEETIESGNAITIKRVKVTGTHVDVYERVFYKWGGNYYYKNGVNITSTLWDKESIE